jgi:hypothetical protein
MNIIKIEFCEDYHDCETCGISYADGAIVYLNDKEILNLKPSAYCYDSINYFDEDIFDKIIEYLKIPNLDIPENIEYTEEFFQQHLKKFNYEVEFIN